MKKSSIMHCKRRVWPWYRGQSVWWS